ncbi:hypothetical protein OpiT1DRAFT_00167 [Opitutaceae bacterium TAV1]|nr:hypothetical protein OpiT1DRAFT_00167 [Opitutaceae bacterium TAV1]
MKARRGSFNRLFRACHKMSTRDPGSEAGNHSREIRSGRSGDISRRASGESPIVTPGRRRSRLELRGDQLPEGTLADAEGTGGISRDLAEPAGNPGREVPLHDEPDEQATSERLAIEGVEEAQHDQMLAARRRDRRRSGPE